MGEAIGTKVERIDRLLKALDIADGKEDFIIHRSHALNYVKAELRQLMASSSTEESLSKEELLMALKTLNSGPPFFKRKNNYEILEVLLGEKIAEKQKAGEAGEAQ